MLNVSRVAIAKLLGVCLSHDLINRDMLSLLLPLAIEDSMLAQLGTSATDSAFKAIFLNKMLYALLRVYFGYST